MLRRCVGTFFTIPLQDHRMEQDRRQRSPSPCGRGPGGGVTLRRLQFRRQAPIGPYIADFFCPAARLVVEIDGATHTDSVADAARDRWMHAQGLVVLRFRGDEVAGNLEGVLERIRELAAARR